MSQEDISVEVEALRHFCRKVFEALDVPHEDAAITADVLVAANLALRERAEATSKPIPPQSRGKVTSDNRASQPSGLPEG